MAEKERLNLVNKGLHSPATTYLLSVLENKTEDDFDKGSTNEERVRTAFASLSEIIPHCGIYSPVLKLIKEELFAAVYSDRFTTSEPGQSAAGRKNVASLQTPHLQQVPYFSLLKSLRAKRNEAADDLQKVIDRLQGDVRELNASLLKRDQEIDSLMKKLTSLDKELILVNGELEKRSKEISDLNTKLIDQEMSYDAKHRALTTDLNTLSEKERELKDENSVLRPYQNGYHTLKDTFDLPPEKRPKRGFRRPVIATKKTQLLASIEAASKLEQQILEIQNKTLEEQDLYLEEMKDKLSVTKFSETSSDPNYFNEEILLESMKDEVSMKQVNFQRLISGMVVESELVRAHREALQNELNQIEQVELGARAVADGDGSLGGGTMVPSSMAGGRPGSSRMLLLDDGKKNGRDSCLSLGESGLEEDDSKLTDPSGDLFNPQERVMSKYSAMIYTSVNGGKSFDEVTSARYCVSCGEKTAICPHKVTKGDMIIRLPKRCTHVKLSRPQIRISVSLSQQGVPQTASTMYPGRAGADTWSSSRPEPHGWDGTNDWVIEEETKQQLVSLWDDFKSRTGMERYSLLSVSRDLPHSRILSLVEQVYTSIIWRDDLSTSPDAEDDVGTFKDYLYNFIEERYQEDEVTPMATFDFIAGVTKYAAHDKAIQLFGQAVAGVIDGSIPRYVHLIADLIDMVEWQEVKDFCTFSEVLYPFLPEEDVDQLVVEYIAFSENKISKSLLLEYLIHIVLKKKEPRIQEAENKLSSVQVAKDGEMQMTEFISAMESIAPLTSERLWKKLMKETFKLNENKSAPVSSLAGILAYVSLVQIIHLLKGHIRSKVEKARQSRAEEAGGRKTGVSSRVVAEAGRLLTIEKMKKLAFNISRQRQAGSRAMENDFEDFYWHSRPNTRDSTA